MKKTINVIFIILFVLLNRENYAQQYTLEDVLRMTIQNHPLIKQKEDEIKAAQFKVEQQKSYYLPNISAQADYKRIGPIPAFNFGGENIELAPANNYNANIIVKQILYDFGKRDAQVEYSKSFLNSIYDNEELIKDDLADQAVKVFYGIMFLEKSAAVKDTQSVALKEHLNITGLKIKNGTATEYDVLSTKTRLIEINNEKIELLNEINKQEIYLKELMGIDRGKDISISGKFELPVTLLNSDSLLSAAYNNRPELKLANDALITAQLQKETAANIDNPALTADAGYGFKNGFEPNINAIRGNWFAGISLNVPIFNGNLKENKVNEYQSEINAVGQKLNRVKETISTDVYKAISDIKADIKKINSTEEQIEFAGKSLELAKARYLRESGTNLEVLDAETSLTQARLLNIQAVYKSLISYYTLKRAVGDKIFLN